jgi:hypothetical protein
MMHDGVEGVSLISVVALVEDDERELADSVNLLPIQCIQKNLGRHHKHIRP